MHTDNIYKHDLFKREKDIRDHIRYADYCEILILLYFYILLGF